MKVRPARVADAPAICGIINYYAERGRMLHRSLESVYDALREFQVAQDGDGSIVGCAALDIYWADLAELKSLAVLPDRRGAGIGSRLVAAVIRDARRLGVRRIFVLTYEKAFFREHGFRVVSRDRLPDKVWRECMGCPKEDACDEIAMMKGLGRTGRRRPARRRPPRPRDQNAAST